MSAAEESSLNAPVKTLGIVAGGGSLPERLLQACDRQDIGVFVIAFRGQTDPRVYKGRHHMLTRLGAAGKIVDTLKAHGVRDLVWIGSIRRPSIAELRPDMRTIKFFARLGLNALGDDGLLRAVRREFEMEGFRLHGVQEFAPDLLAAEGIVGKHQPGNADWPNIERGLKIAQTLGDLDVGQAVIMQEGIVLGVEGVEGTDELIKRCGGYRRKGRGGILVKTCKPGQDRNLDLPTIGPETVKNCAEAGLHGIVFYAGLTLLIDPQEVADLADKHNIFVVGLSPAKKKDAF